MSKKRCTILSLVPACLLGLALCGCSFAGGGLPKIATPEVVIGLDGVAVWGEVGHAIYYEYILGGKEGELTLECSLQLNDGDTIRVKAVSGDENFADSDYSAPQTYRKEAVDPNHVHSDVNDDGLCDKGGEKVTVDLTFLAVNDLHGKFKDTSSQPGLDEFTTYLKDAYADPAREEILLSSGDMWQGSVESSQNKGRLMTEWMNEAGFVSMTLGNHEFDWGSAVLTPNSELAEFPFLAINVRENGSMPDYCKVSTVVEKGGVKVGIIGAIGDCLSSISGEFRGGLEFETGSMLTALVKNEADRLREKEGCDFIVYSIHDGSGDYSSSGINEVAGDLCDGRRAYYDAELSNGYVDLVFEGHSHYQYIVKDKYGVYHMQGGGENRGVSCAQVTYNTARGEYTVVPKILTKETYAASSLEDDPFIEETYLKYFPDRDNDPYTKALGSNRTTRYETDILPKVAELYLLRGKEKWEGKTVNGAYIDEIVLGGGYLNVRSPKRFNSGNIYYADLYSVLPFDNHIVLATISGRDLLNYFFNGSYTYHAEMHVSQVVSGKTYYIITDTYTSSYRWSINEIARIEEDIYARDLLAEFISEGGWA